LNKERKYISLLIFFLTASIFYSCKESITNPPQEQILFQKNGLADSIVVYGCYSNLDRFFSDTLDLVNYRSIKIDFEGNTNSDGSFIKVYYDTPDTSNVEEYAVYNMQNVNGHHEIEFNKPNDNMRIELRLYILPPVCGQGEFKFTSVRDVNIYGIR
jgi:hypothetical protein